ncbi:MAG: transglutaminase-like domain-containing protein [Janthinobacterium lividum]
MRKWEVPAACAAVFLLCCGTNAWAKTTTFTGTMKTQLDFNRTYTVDVGEPIQSLTLSIPMPQPGSVFSYAETAGQATIDSSIPPTSETDVIDNFGNALHIVEYDNVLPQTITVHVNITGIALAADLSQPIPLSPLPVAVVGDEANAYLQSTEHSQSDNEALCALAHTITAGTTDEAGAARSISRWMLANITCDAGGPTVRTPALTVLTDHKAKCDGWANLFMALARASGIPARYAAEYWISPQIAYTGVPSVPPQVASDHTHSWVELWYPGTGWVPYEPQMTAGFVDTHHLRVWQLPDSGDSVKTLKFTGTGQTKPDVSFKLTSAFVNIADTLALTPAGVTDPDDAKPLYTRK